ncbi:MAG TPA: M1 family aminopeptidase [Terriglobales bacterium]|nr:M1 family aminopeptidase [Terriglobales bacterium]
MIATIAVFELRQRFRRISTYVYFLVFFALACLFACMTGGAIPGATVDFGTGGKVLLNSPYALNNIIVYVTFFGLVVTAALAGQATYQDVDNNSYFFFYTAPITKFEYLSGRFLGSLAVQFLIFLSVGIGTWVATHLPWIDPTRLGPQRIAAYLQPYFLLVLPNLIFLAAIFFALAALGRKMLPVYAGSVLLLIGYFVAQQLSNNINVNVPGALADPFGGNAIDRLTQYWTPFERNTRLIPLSGILLLNRALWLGVGALILAYTYHKFTFAYPLGRAKAGKAEAVAEIEAMQPVSESLPVVHPSFSGRASFAQFLSLTGIQLIETVKNVFFIVLLLAGAGLAIMSASGLGNPFATPVYPVTYIVLEGAAAGFLVFALAIITFYAGELVWRERDAQLNQIMDALPVQRWVFFTSKLSALMLVQVVLALTIFISGIIVQVWHGYYHFQLAIYFKELVGNRLIQYCMIAVLAMFVHTLVNQKYAGHFVMVLYFVALLGMTGLGLQHYLYRPMQAPSFIYSDMNGYGPFARPLFWFRLYWGWAALILAIVTNLLWVRGTEGDWGVRLALAKGRISGLSVVGLIACATAMAATGAYIYYNTNVLNRYRTSYQADEMRAQYEKKYRQYKSMPEPRIVDLKTHIDVYPEKRAVEMQGSMWLENKTNAPIDRVGVTIWPIDLAPIRRPDIEIKTLIFTGGQQAVLEDKDLGFYIYRLNTPLAPKARIQFEADLFYPNVGFVNDTPNTDLVRNGTALGDRYLPFIGYTEDVELTDDSTRHRHGLERLKRMPKLENTAAHNDNMISSEADWINFESTVSTAPDQTAIMPGYLQREWTENGRRYFNYKMDAPILNLFSLNSARYAVRRDRWHDVNLEIYYQPGHEFDLDRMMASMKASLDYFSRNFSPFQFHQLRIIEFPRYQAFAASFANTIPFSESVGFITYVDPKDPKALNLPFYVTAHEVAHQWWGHQVVSANVEGGTSIVETLAQYGAMMVMKHQLGPEAMKGFLRMEMDAYLRGRGQERNEEMPLDRVDANQGYIHYYKGAVVMYALQDYIGEDKVNQALAEFIKAYGFKGAPYPTSLDMIGYFQKVTPPEYQYLYDDMFKNITLYDNRAKSATFTQRPDGKYQIGLVLESKKLRSDGRGQESEIPVHDWIDVGVTDASGHYLYLQKHRIDAASTQLTLTVDKAPTGAGIDPLNKLIDRNPDDNMMRLEKH